MDSSTSIWQKLYKVKAHHILLWVLYYAFFMTLYRGFYSSIWPLFVVTSVYFIFNASSFYLTAYYLFPKYLHTRKYLKFAVSFLAVIFIFSLMLSICLYFLFRDYSKEVVANKQFLFFTAFFAIVTIVGILSSAKLVSEKIRNDRSAERLESERMAAELQYLRAQVNPHFLFNAINSIYFLIKKDADVAAATLIKLSDLLRFQLYDCSDEKIAIEKEVEYLNNFVALEKIRKGEKIKVDFVASSELQGFQVAPFMLMPFVENAFKYVSGFSSNENKIIVKLWREENQFHAHFFNTTDNLVRSAVGGIGHKNVKRRLELIYPGKHQLQIVERPGTYKVMLRLEVE
jgi:two-component system LytT family sensor kinase